MRNKTRKAGRRWIRSKNGREDGAHAEDGMERETRKAKKRKFGFTVYIQENPA